MKKWICGLLTGALFLSVCMGCTQPEPKKEPSFPAELTVQKLLDSGAFSETLEELDPMLLFPLRGSAEDYNGSVLYYSTGATAETVAVITSADEELLAAAEETLRLWLDYQIESEKSYRPAEAQKLERAILEKRGFSILLVVAADWDKAAAAIPAE